VQKLVETILKSKGTTVIVSPQRPTVLIGEKISAAARNDLANALRDGDLGPLQQEANDQVTAGADVLEVNVGAPGVDEVEWLPRAVRAIIESVDVPVSIDTTDFEALEAALAIHRRMAPQGKPLINSVNGEERYLKGILPLAAEYGAAVIGMALDDGGASHRQSIPRTPEARLAVARKIVERAEAAGVPREDVVIDCMALSVSTDPEAGRVTLQAIRKVREELGVNMALGPSNVSFGLPERGNLNWAFMAMAMQNGVNCPIVNVSRDRPFILAIDVLLGRDPYAERYIAAHRRRSGQE
jgi:5-methyltetrahydrofolate--homocysteine methyltransferase